MAIPQLPLRLQHPMAPLHHHLLPLRPLHLRAHPPSRRLDARPRLRIRRRPRAPIPLQLTRPTRHLRSRPRRVRRPHHPRRRSVRRPRRRRLRQRSRRARRHGHRRNALGQHPEEHLQPPRWPGSAEETTEGRVHLGVQRHLLLRMVSGASVLARVPGPAGHVHGAL